MTGSQGGDELGEWHRIHLYAINPSFSFGVRGEREKDTILFDY